MTLFGLHISDVCTLAIYLLGITALGMWMGRTIHNTTDFFVGGRRFGKVLSTFFAFGAGTHSDQAVSVAAKTYTTGMSGIWYQWLWLFVTPFYWVITPIYRRCRCITTGDFFEARYARSVAMLFVVVGILNLMVNIGTMLKGSGAVIGATTGNQLSEDVAIALMTILFVAYGVVGGFAAAVVTDFVQGLLTIVFSFILLPFAIIHIGGFTALHEKVAATFQAHPAPGVPNADAMWSLSSPGEITVFYIVIITLNALIGVVAQPQSLPGGNASKTEREAQFGAVGGNLIKRFCTVAWCLLGLCAFVMFEGMTDKEQIDQAFGLIAHKLLPQIAPGLIGVFIASLLASIMSSCDAFMITCSGLFTHNLYRPLTKGNKSEAHYVNVGRVAAAVVVAGGVFFAYRFESVLDGLELFWKISALMGITFWAGLFWRRATAAGAWAGTLIAFGIVVFTSDYRIASHEVWSFTKHIANTWKAEIPTDRQKQLDSETLTDELRTEFGRGGVRFSADAVVKAEDDEEVGVKWLILDGDRKFTIHRQDTEDRLEVRADPLRFTIDAKLAGSLDDRELTNKLHEALAAGGIELTDEAGVSVEDKKRRTVKWLVNDGQQCCMILRGDNGLDVYVNRLPLWMMRKGELSLPWQMIMYLSAGLGGLVIVSLLTPRPDEAKLDHFYGVIRTPVKPGEVIDAPFTLPAGIEASPSRKLINRANWEIQVPSLRSVVGFLVVSAIGIALMGSVVIIIGIGT